MSITTETIHDRSPSGQVQNWNISFHFISEITSYRFVIFSLTCCFSIGCLQLDKVTTVHHGRLLPGTSLWQQQLFAYLIISTSFHRLACSFVFQFNVYYTFQLPPLPIASMDQDARARKTHLQRIRRSQATSARQNQLINNSVLLFDFSFPFFNCVSIHLVYSHFYIISTFSTVC